MTVCTLLAGSVTDAIGLRRTFFLGVCVCLFARAVMVFTTIKWLALAGGLFPLVIGEALGTPVLIAATRRYSTTRQRSISFSLIYSIMNVGFFVAARIYDYVRQNLGEHGHFNLFGEQISTYRTLFLVSFLFELTILVPIYFLRRGAEATDEGGVRFEPESSRHAGAEFWKRVLLTVRDSAWKRGRLFKRLLGQSGFYRLLAFLLLIGFLKLIVMQMDYVFPKFGIRELGDGAPIGQLSAINYLLIILLVPTIGALTQQFSAYRMVIVGGSDLRSFRLYHGAADFLVSGVGERRCRKFNRSHLSWVERRDSSVLRRMHLREDGQHAETDAVIQMGGPSR